MTRTLRASLGSSALIGKQAIDRTRRFKQQLCSLSPKPEHISLLTVTHADPPHMEVVALYDADDPVACAWARRGERVCAELWQMLNERRTAVRGR